MRWIYLAIVVVFLLAILIFVVQNRELVTMSFLGFGVRAPLAIEQCRFEFKAHGPPSLLSACSPARA